MFLNEFKKLLGNNFVSFFFRLIFDRVKNERMWRNIGSSIRTFVGNGAFNARVKSDWKLLLLRFFFKYSPCFDDPSSARTPSLNKKIPRSGMLTRFFDAAYRTRDTQAKKNAILPVFFSFVYFSFQAFSIRHNRFRRVHVIIPHKLVKIRQGCFIYLTYRKSYNIELEFSWNYYTRRIVKLIPSLLPTFLCPRVVSLHYTRACILKIIIIIIN